MNFMFEWHEQYALTCEILFLPREHKIHIFQVTCNVLFIIWTYWWRRFWRFSKDFRPLSKDFPKLFRRPDERSRTFSENFQKFPKMSEDSWRLLGKTRRCFDDPQTNLSTIKETNLISVKSSISSHVWLSYRFYQFVITRYTTDFHITKTSLCFCK